MLVKFISNNDEIKKSLPFNNVDMGVLPEIGHKVKLSSICTAKVTEITHCLTGSHDVEIYLSAV